MAYRSCQGSQRQYRKQRRQIQKLTQQVTRQKTLVDVIVKALIKGPEWLPSDSAFKGGVHVQADIGAGKSRVLGRGLTFHQAILRKRPTVIMDCTRGSIDNLLDKLMRVSIALPYEFRPLLWKRIDYVHAAATDFNLRKQIYFYRSPDESLFTSASRFVDIILKADPDLRSASIQGANAVIECGIYAGMIACALERQIDFVADLVRFPGKHKAELAQALSRYPEVEPAVNYFRSFMDPNMRQQKQRITGSFLVKLIPFLVDPILRATYGAPSRDIDWEKHEAERRILLLDYSRVEGATQQFHMMWDLHDFMGYVDHRGMAGRGREICFLIDEFAALLGYRSNETSIMADKLEELITRYSRNYGVNTIIAHQNLGQLGSVRIANALMAMANQYIGHVAHPDERHFLARYFLRYDPYRVKEEVPVYMKLPDLSKPMEKSYASSQSDSWSSSLRDSSVGGSTSSTTHRKPAQTPQKIDSTNVYFTPEEQVVELADSFASLKVFEFYMRLAQAEGDFTGTLERVSFANFDPGQYPDAAVLDPLYARLREKTGVPLHELQAEIDSLRFPDELKSKKRGEAGSSQAILPSQTPNTYGKYRHKRPIQPKSHSDFWVTEEEAYGDSTNGS